MGLKEKLDKDMVAAQKAGDKLKLSVTRMLKSEIKYKEIEKKDQLDEAGLIDVLSSAAKRRRESIEGFSKGNRPDLVEKEKQELEIIQQYLPQQMTSTEVSQLIDEIIFEVGAVGASDKGKVMKALMPKLKGRFDGKEAGLLVASRLEQKPSQGGELP
ncbi:MAG: GatB/YqeY domain-containing protein [candidate division Zixibacteria bacterium]|nr:GatB/YqeY domain-containing protein [candidate division Zixibacteria bacterium]